MRIMRDEKDYLTGSEGTAFKLPLSVFEYYMFLDDCAGNTMTLPLSITVAGKIDRAAIESAYFSACELHPLFCATISKRDRCWHKAEKPEGIIWLEADDNNLFPWDEQHIDITQSTGLRLAIVDSGETSVFHFLFHHCVADGVGFFQFLNSFFSCYLKNIGQNITPLQYDIANLVNRAKYKLSPPPKRVTFFSAVKFLVVEVLRWFMCRPLLPVSQSVSEPAVPSTKYQSYEKCDFEIAGELVQFELRRWGKSGFIFVRLSREMTSRILVKSKSHNFTIGDMLLSGLFISLANSKYLSFADAGGKIKEIRGNEFLRVGLVNNMRGVGTDLISGCNMISYSFPMRQFMDCCADTDFCKKVSEELRYIKDYNVGKTFMDGLSFFMRVPFFINKFIKSNRCLASVILSSMNRLELFLSGEFPRDEFGVVHVGGMRLLDFSCAAPYRRGTPISVATNTYAGQLGFFVQYDTNKITQKDTANWLTEWINIIVKEL
ncbi:MAG: hypothetical protein LBT09_11465 [Planctomycetaceae bacterium]|jgi:hypothetical protein|nr:hypothetical protein [Planctomycetaceae bacterium]